MKRAAAGRAHVGTSGWSYDAWRESFYAERPKREWLRNRAGKLGALGRSRRVRHAAEIRHASWFCDEVATCLSAHCIANHLSDAGDGPLRDAVATNLVDVRLRGHALAYASDYTLPELRAAQRAAARVGASCL